jgi:hypothetical protein
MGIVSRCRTRSPALADLLVEVAGELQRAVFPFWEARALGYSIATLYDLRKTHRIEREEETLILRAA